MGDACTVSKKFRPFVRPDMTWQQRKDDKKLRDELKSQRECGEQDLVIRGGHIISKQENPEN